MRARHLPRFGCLAAATLSALLILALPADARSAGKKAHKAHSAPASSPLKIPNAQFEAIDWNDIDGWANDDHKAAFATLLASCRALVGGAKHSKDRRSMRRGLVDVCHRARAVTQRDNDTARKFFEKNFRPVRIAKIGEKDGFLTGYYEPVVDGSRVRTAEYNIPLYRRPKDLIPGKRRSKSAGFSNKGPVFRRIGKKKLVPYYERAEIDNGALDSQQLEICWLKDPIDAFFIHIQGSARVRLEDGSTLRVNYDSHNGQPYTPVGRILIERNIYTREEMSMDKIREWMTANPEEGRALRQMNKSFVFFRVTNLADHEEATGAQGVQLTAGRSIAVDKALHVYGTPFFIEGDLPIDSEQPETRFRRLMVSQDTGSAIVGPARADIYFGAGEKAAHPAGRLKHNARFTMLVPKTIKLAVANAIVPLPPPRPELTKTSSAVAKAAPPAAKSRLERKHASIVKKAPGHKHKRAPRRQVQQ